MTKRRIARVNMTRGVFLSGKFPEQIPHMENDMEEKHFDFPLELNDTELDEVAAAGGWSGGNNFQIGLVNLNDTNVGVNVLGLQLQGT